MIEALHFLRPDWFYAFIPLGVLLYLIRHNQSSHSSWQRICDPQLIPHILHRTNNTTRRLPLFLALLAASITIVSLAGPVWKKLPTPVFTDTSALVIALDLSQSMNSNDLRPSRIARAKLKTQDLLAARKTGQTALIVFAARAYTVTPLTEDANTILNLLPTLETSLMPVQGSAADAALELAAQLFAQTGIEQGDVLLITDDASNIDIQTATQLREQGHRISVFATGTIDGAPIPLDSGSGYLTDQNGAIVIPVLARDTLRQLAMAGGGRYVELQNDDSDTAELTRFYAAKTIGADIDPTDLSADTWREEGPWLLLLVIPLAALWFRRGWLACLAVFFLPFAEPVYALDGQNLWWSPDQKAQHQFNQGNHSQAAELFQRPDWKAAALYNTGNYLQAIKILDTLDTSDAYYNKGNALAKLNRFHEAIKAYDEAIRRNENHHNARHNRLLVQQALLNQEHTPNLKPGEAEEDSQNEQGTPPPDGNPQDSPSTPQEAEDSSSAQPAQRNPDSESEEDAQPADRDDTEPQSANNDSAQQNSKPENSESPSEDQLPDEQMTDAGDVDTDTPQDDNEPPPPENPDNAERDEQQLVTEQWLNRIPDDPGGLLRRKFLHQYGNQATPPQSNKTW